MTVTLRLLFLAFLHLILIVSHWFVADAVVAQTCGSCPVSAQVEYLHIEFYSQEVGELLNRNNCWNKSIFPAHIIHKNSYTTARPVRQVIINHGQVLLSSSLIPLNCVILRRLLPPPTSLESIILNYYIIESLGTNHDHVYNGDNSQVDHLYQFHCRE